MPIQALDNCVQELVNVTWTCYRRSVEELPSLQRPVAEVIHASRAARYSAHTTLVSVLDAVTRIEGRAHAHQRQLWKEKMGLV